jgi:F-type H+-transporting ATPase subunit b
MLEIDFSLWPPGTLWIQIFNFLLLLFLMNIFLYKPIRHMLARRKAETRALEGTIENYQNRSSDNEKGIEEGLVRIRKEGNREKELLKGEGAVAEKEVLQKAFASADAKMDQARQEIENRMIEVRKTLDQQVSAFSEELAEKILGRSVR